MGKTSALKNIDFIYIKYDNSCQTDFGPNLLTGGMIHNWKSLFHLPVKVNSPTRHLLREFIVVRCGFNG